MVICTSSIETESALLQPLKGSRRGLFWQLQNIPIKSFYFDIVLCKKDYALVKRKEVLKGCLKLPFPWTLLDYASEIKIKWIYCDWYLLADKTFLKVNLEELILKCCGDTPILLLGYWFTQTYCCDNACDCAGSQRFDQSPFFGADIGSFIQLYYLQSCGLAGTFRDHQKFISHPTHHIQGILHVYLVLLLHPNAPYPHPQCHPVSQPPSDFLEKPDYDSGCVWGANVPERLFCFSLDHHEPSRGVSKFCDSCSDRLPHLSGL